MIKTILAACDYEYNKNPPTPSSSLKEAPPGLNARGLGSGDTLDPLDALGGGHLRLAAGREIAHASLARLDVTVRRSAAGPRISDQKGRRDVEMQGRMERKATYPVHSIATQPAPLHTSHFWGLAAQPATSSLAQLTGAVCGGMVSGGVDMELCMRARKAGRQEGERKERERKK
jgi:hypothetical protein